MPWLLLVLLITPPALAQDAPSCVPARAGQAACIAGRQCLCGFERGGSLAGRPDRWAWDCGILRPGCAVPPTDLAPAPGPALPGLVIMPQVTPPGRPAPLPR